MIMIRMSRGGRKLKPFFSIVATDSREARNSGNYLEKLGHYDPKAKVELTQVNVEGIKAWIGKGAQMSDSVRTLLKKHKISL